MRFLVQSSAVKASHSIGHKMVGQIPATTPRICMASAEDSTPLGCLVQPSMSSASMHQGSCLLPGTLPAVQNDAASRCPSVVLWSGDTAQVMDWKFHDRSHCSTVPLSKGWLAICTWNGHPYSCSVLSGGRYGCKRCKSNHRGDLRNSTAWEGLWSETGGKGQQGKRHASGSICSQLITFSCLYGILEQVGRHFEQKGECDDLQYGKVICQPCESRIDSHQGPASPFSPLVDLCILPARRTEACLETSSLSDGVAA